MTYTQPRAIMASVILAAFGLFLLWKGITGDIPKTLDGNVIFPRWVYTVGGAVVLILPIAYIIALLRI